jgi:hypothetical protein
MTFTATHEKNQAPELSLSLMAMTLMSGVAYAQAGKPDLGKQ